MISLSAGAARPLFLRFSRLCLVALLASSPLSYSADADVSLGPTEVTPPKSRVRTPEPVYAVQVGIDGEIFPVFANYASLQQREERTWGMVGVTVSNSTDAVLRHRVTVQVPGWSDQEIQLLEMAAGDVRTLIFAPTFLPRLYRNKEIAAATVVVRATDMGGRLVFEQTVPVRLRAAGDMFWGTGFRYAPFIASWVTPHDPRIELLLSRAKEYMPGRRLPGYEEWKTAEQQEKSTELQAEAIYRALQEAGISYVKSSLTFGRNTSVSERIRMPREALRQSSANCIDGVVMFASLFENLGMEPSVVLVPGHAYVGVRVARNTSKYLYLDTALTGRASFDAAVEAAGRGLARYDVADVSYIRISEARRAGIFPMPEAGFADGGDEIVLTSGSARKTTAEVKDAAKAPRR
jgi:hypothetical protein